MRLILFTSFAALLSVFVAVSNTSATSGWQPLFDGKTFAGWDDPAKRTPPGDSWTIEDGCLVAKAKPRIREDLFTTRTFENYEFEWDWKIEPGGNSGVKYNVQRSEFFDLSKVSSSEIQAQILEQIEKKVSDRSRIAPDSKGKDYSIAFEFQLI